MYLSLSYKLIYEFQDWVRKIMGNENGSIYEWKGMRRIYAMGAVLVFVEETESVYFNYWEMEVKDQRLHVVFPFHVDFFSVVSC